MPDKIGEFLVKIGAMTQMQVDYILQRQAKGDKRMFGEIAVELRYINDHAIRQYVDHLDKYKKEPGTL